MQKKLIVLAIAALASTSAFADTTSAFYGLVDVTVVSASGDGLQSNAQVIDGGLATSRLGFKAAEDLDGGIKAVVNLEYALAPSKQTAPGATATATLNARNQYIGLAGDFGTVVAGYLETAGNDFGKKYDVFGGSALSPLQAITYKSGVNGANGFLIGTKALATRTQNAIAYISPNISGLVLAVNYTTAFATNNTTNNGNFGLATATADTQISAALFAADYTAGPLAVNLTYAATNAAAYLSNETEYAIGASYNLGVATIKATYQDTKASNATGVAGSDNKAMSIGAAIPVGNDAVAVSFAKSTIGTVTDADASGYAVAYLHNMSKTVTAYVGYESAKNGSASSQVSVLNSGLSNVQAGGATTVVAFGLLKKF
jgi:predicted porin